MFENMPTVREKFAVTEKSPFFKERQHFLEQKIKGTMGSTWDASHLTSFLNKSFYSNKKSPENEDHDQKKSYSIRRKKSGDYFFKNLRYDQNKSLIGYTKVNPLVANIEISQQRQKALVNFFLSRADKVNQERIQNSSILKQSNDDGKFRFESNSVKFRGTDPLTSRYEPESPEKLGYSIERMKRQIASRHPHGITGVDHPQGKNPKFYESSRQKEVKIREQEHNSHTSFELDREWKRKKRVTPISQEFRFRHTECIRKFRNENSHGYNILTNREVDEQ